VTIFEWYVLRRFLHVFGILFVTTFGLFVVIDCFTNVDAFQEQGGGAVGMLRSMGGYYLFQSSLFLELTGQMLAVIGVVVVFAMLAKHGEVHPILAAGVPAYRLVVPVLFGVLLVHGGLMVNQELVIPGIAHHLQQGRGSDEKSLRVEPVYDHASHILISGRELFLEGGRMHDAEFVLPTPGVADELTTLKASEAAYYPPAKNRPAGWRLYGVTPPLADVRLSEAGRKLVRPLKAAGEAFVVSDVTADQLFNRSRNFTFVSTPELVKRIKKPAAAFVSVRAQEQHLHLRLTRPLLSLALVFVAVPLILRRESRGLVINMAVCTGVLGLAFGVGQLFQFLGSTSLAPVDLAAWGGIITAGTLGAWYSGVVQT
jgi:lipopolysaccharide export system permease protein